jgi:protein-L-isoaspartate(D-aspartate) O-methyltransferase
MEHSTRQLNMIESQLRPNNIIDENLISAFQKVKQENFLPEELKKLSYMDDHISFSKKSFILKPLIFAKFLNILKLESSDVVLEIGSGGGYTASILSGLVNNVYSVEEDKNAYDLSLKNIKNNKFINIKNFYCNYKQLNIPEIKFDKIIINGSVNADPVNLLEKLKINGKLICVLKIDSSSNIYLYNKKDKGYEKLKITNANAPILINYIDKEEFNF